MNQLALAMPEARADGMDAALEHAGDEWRNEAYTFLIGFAKANRQPFCGEQVSDAHIAAGLPQPPDLRAWGGLYRRAQHEGVIERLDNDGWSKRRASPCPRYVSRVFA